jgi:hypothetical protein
MAKINPTFYDDMQKVFQTERNKEDSERYIEKLKKCEDTIIKSPVTNDKVLYELSYERTRMNLYLKNLRYRKKIKTRGKSIWDKIKFYKDRKNNKKDEINKSEIKKENENIL